jgi:hypothetical protein
VIQQTITVGEKEAAVQYSATEAARHLNIEESEESTVAIEILQWLDDENEKFKTDGELLLKIKEVVDTLENSEGWAGGIRDIAQSIVDECPPDQYIYVGLGRSPSPLVAYLSTHGYTAVTLPLGA